MFFKFDLRLGVLLTPRVFLVAFLVSLVILFLLRLDEETGAHYFCVLDAGTFLGLFFVSCFLKRTKQVHFFNSPSNGKLVGKLNWRIKEPDGEFFTRDVVQKFQQDPSNPAHLVNKDNDYLHYRGKDDKALITHNLV